MKLLTTKELHDLTLSWSKDRKIIPNGKPTTQALKLVSEFGELCNSVNNGSSIQDDLGDMLVVLTNLLGLYSKMDLFTIVENFIDIKNESLVNTTNEPTLNRQNTKDILIYLGSMIGDLSDAVIKNEEIETLVYNIVNTMNMLGEDLNTCWTIAWNDIKDRTGFLNKNGTFIKSTDPRYTELLAEEEK